MQTSFGDGAGAKTVTPAEMSLASVDPQIQTRNASRSPVPKETRVAYSAYIGIMAKKMETTIVYWGYIVGRMIWP